MDNSTAANVVSSTNSLSPLSSTTKEIPNDGEGDSSPDAGTAIGVTIAVLVVVLAIVAGIVLYIKRRNGGNVEPIGKDGKNDIEMQNPARTSWHEIDLTSNRSSGISTIVDYSVETADDHLEMQPSTMFPGTGISMYDNDSIDEDINALDAHPTESSDQTDTNGGRTSESETSSVEDGSTGKPRDSTGVSSRSNKAGDRTTVILDEHTKSFRIRVDESEINENETTKPGKEGSQIEKHISNGSAKVGESDKAREETEIVKQLQEGYELAKVIPDNASENEQSNVVIIISSPDNTTSADESGNPNQDTNYVNVQMDNGNMYVNHAAVERESSSQQTSKANLSAANNDAAPPKPPRLSQYTDKPEEMSNINKAPIPQPRRSKRLRMNSKDNNFMEDIGQGAPEEIKECSASEDIDDGGASENVHDESTSENDIDNDVYENVSERGASENVCDRDAFEEQEGRAVSEKENEKNDIDNSSNDTQTVHSGRVDEYVEYDPYDSDPDYDTADPIYDVPRSSKEVEIKDN